MPKEIKPVRFFNDPNKPLEGMKDFTPKQSPGKISTDTGGTVYGKSSPTEDEPVTKGVVDVKTPTMDEQAETDALIAEATDEGDDQGNGPTQPTQGRDGGRKKHKKR